VICANWLVVSGRNKAVIAWQTLPFLLLDLICVASEDIASFYTIHTSVLFLFKPSLHTHSFILKLVLQHKCKNA
jgi:hypothetical protein